MSTALAKSRITIQLLILLALNVLRISLASIDVNMRARNPYDETSLNTGTLNTILLFLIQTSFNYISDNNIYCNILVSSF